MNKMIIVIILILASTFFISSGCKKEEVTQIVSPSIPNPVKGSWTVQSIKLETKPPFTPYIGYDQPTWRTYLINSGILTTFGNITATFTDSNFAVVGALSPSLSTYFPAGLNGNASGVYLLESPKYLNVGPNIVDYGLVSWSPPQMFHQKYSYYGEAIQGTYTVGGNFLTLNFLLSYSVHSPDNLTYGSLTETFTVVLLKN